MKVHNTLIVIIFQAVSGESLDTACEGRQKVIGVGGSESSFIYQLCMMDCDWMSDELVPTMLLTQYLSQCEGMKNLIHYLWVANV